MVAMADVPYFIKPESVSLKVEIRAILQERFWLVTYADFIYTREILDLQYDNVSLAVRKGIYRMMEGEPGEVGIVRGSNALQELVRLCGKETDPMQCEEGTIRRRFGWSNRILLAEGFYFYGNVIHRPKNPKELERDMKIARQFLKI